MKFRTLIVLLLISGSTCLAQDSIRKVKFILVIDGDVPVASVSNCNLKLLDSQQREIPINYDVGELSMTSEDYERIMSSGLKSRVLLSFQYRQIRLTNETYRYEQNMEVRCITGDYLILKITNYKRKTQQRFNEYSIKYTIPGYSFVSPKRSSDSR